MFFEILLFLSLSIILVGFDFYIGPAILLGLWVISSVFYLHSIPFEWFYQNPGIVLLFVLLYVTIGVGWSIIKVVIMVRDKKKEIELIAEKYVKASNEIKVKYPTFEEYYKFAEGYRDWDFPRFQISNHKAEIAAWIGYWWVSMVLTFFGDWLKRFFNWVYDVFANLYQNIANSIYDYSK